MTALSRKERIILGLLIELGPSYGLELVKASPLRGTVYVHLFWMSRKGYVANEKELGKLRFFATDDGRRCYAAWETSRMMAHKAERL